MGGFKKLACIEAPRYADARGHSRRHPHGGGRRGRPPACRTRRRAPHTHHPTTRPDDSDYERGEKHHTDTHAGSGAKAIPTPHPLLMSRNPVHGWQVYSTADRSAHSPVPTALRPPRAVASTAKPQACGPRTYLRCQLTVPPKHKTKPSRYSANVCERASMAQAYAQKGFGRVGHESRRSKDGRKRPALKRVRVSCRGLCSAHAQI